MAIEYRNSNQRHGVIRREVVLVIFKDDQPECVNETIRRIARNKIHLTFGDGLLNGLNFIRRQALGLFGRL